MEPRPREAKLPNCIGIAAYGSGFFFFFVPWMDNHSSHLVLKIAVLVLLTFMGHFMLLYRRQWIYSVFCRVARKRIRFFEFPFFTIIFSLYVVVFLVIPLSWTMVTIKGGVSPLILDENSAQYLLFGIGAAIVIGAISGFDIYPVNLFSTKSGIEHLITITKSLMKTTNRGLVVVTGSIVAGWVFKKVEFSQPVIYLTVYAILGVAMGGTAALGARITELLYLLAELESLEGEPKGTFEPTDSSMPPRLND